MPTVTIPHRSTPNPAPITQHQRLALLRQLVNRDDIPPQDRVAAVLVLLHAKPLTRITRLCTDDVQHEDGKVLVRLGDPPSPVPAPFDGMLLDYLGQRPNTRTATNPSARWLLPGRRAGQPMTPEAMAPRLPDPARTHSGDPPTRPPGPGRVVARMLGHNDDHATRMAEEAGGTRRHHAPGDQRR
ncbi:hypothetical protein HKX69_34925 [Streptomyces argyrophyllae]|uniref:Tyr recombinase domain-containing protein n=1 Tax=Streptomyces argyrophylli TaxID=2726118 RepID=A0A6M4PTS6_9ACTN|nr:hypothetical protein [Streptomyces argyrophyllae]QJS14029.1 hypothetical protein HKX69_34925 [Streptomyces argyrophyllae]